MDPENWQNPKELIYHPGLCIYQDHLSDVAPYQKYSRRKSGTEEDASGTDANYALFAIP